MERERLPILVADTVAVMIAPAVRCQHPPRLRGVVRQLAEVGSRSTTAARTSARAAPWLRRRGRFSGGWRRSTAMVSARRTSRSEKIGCGCVESVGERWLKERNVYTVPT